MNAKTAKRLRKEANYKPGKKATTYEKTNGSRKVGHSGSIEVHAADPRYLYRELKKEHKNASK